MEQLSKKDLEPIHKAIDELNRSSTRIENALLGDEDMNIEGIAKKVARHDKYIRNSKQRAAWGIGAAGGLGFGLHTLVDWIKTIFH